MDRVGIVEAACMGVEISKNSMSQAAKAYANCCGPLIPRDAASKLCLVAGSGAATPWRPPT
jgi:hypothetical protein